MMQENIPICQEEELHPEAIRQVREGSYEHRTHIPGHDEIAQIGEEFNSLTDRLQTTEEARRRFNL